MQRFHQVLFVVCLLGLCWLGMMAVHELGHVAGALLTGGAVECVVLHPAMISRTDVRPNPMPAVVVWLGPLVGTIVPALAAVGIPKRFAVAKNIGRFFAGFCLIANGAYIGGGASSRVGDCGEMLRTGSPLWLLWLFGFITIPLGLALWHRLGSPRDFFRSSDAFSPPLAYGAALLLVVFVVLEAALSCR